MTENTCSVRLKRENGKFLDEITIPSRQYPLSGDPEVFYYKNTREITEDLALRVFDSVQFRPGFCFSSAEELVRKLRAAGYDAQYYVGWMFLNQYEYPTHHAWAVLNGDILLDATDFTDLMREKAGELIGTDAEIRSAFNEKVLKTAAEMKNSARIKHPGMVPPGLMYCGAPDTKAHGIEINNRLREMFPNHKAFNKTNESGMTITQQRFYGGAL